MTTPMVTIGIDLGDRKSHACVLDTDGKPIWRGEFPSTCDGLGEFLRSYPGAHVVTEVGGHSRWASAHARGLGNEVTVANPAYVRRIYASSKKSDQCDAEALARRARVDPQLLHGIRHRSRVAQAALAIVKSRDVLVRSRTTTRCRIRYASRAAARRCC